MVFYVIYYITQVADNDLLKVKAKMNSMILSRNPCGVTA
jgi:hypothetical protein